MQSNTKENSPEQKMNIESNIRNSEVSVAAELGSAHISIEDFLFLQRGDVIQLDQNISQPLTVKVDNIPKFTAQPGKALNYLVLVLDLNLHVDP